VLCDTAHSMADAEEDIAGIDSHVSTPGSASWEVIAARQIAIPLQHRVFVGAGKMGRASCI